jgi:hypothetical protein
MNFKDLFNRAKKTVDKPGGGESPKVDATEPKDATGSATDKPKDAAEAVKEPGPPRDAGGSGGN